MIQAVTGSALEEAKRKRALLSKVPGTFVGRSQPTGQGRYLESLANCLLDRQVDIFDDTMLLLEHGRVPSACIVSRGMIETYAVAKELGRTVSQILGKSEGASSVGECLDVVLRFTNSSRFKETEQKKLAKGIFSADDYRFTEEALHRMKASLASSEHVMNALRALYAEERESTKAKESQFEIVYDALSEWVHPSQTSVFHNYTPDTHLIPTSQGPVHLHDAARLHCARALHFISDTGNVHAWLLDLAAEITARAARPGGIGV